MTWMMDSQPWFKATSVNRTIRIVRLSSFFLGGGQGARIVQSLIEECFQEESQAQLQRGGVPPAEPPAIFFSRECSATNSGIFTGSFSEEESRLLSLLLSSLVGKVMSLIAEYFQEDSQAQLQRGGVTPAQPPAVQPSEIPGPAGHHRQGEQRVIKRKLVHLLQF